jgi:hypothetical protein
MISLLVVCNYGLKCKPFQKRTQLFSCEKININNMKFLMRCLCEVVYMYMVFYFIYISYFNYVTCVVRINCSCVPHSFHYQPILVL